VPNVPDCDLYLAHVLQEDQKKATVLRDLVEYCATKGQAIADSMGYIPLPTNIVEKIKAAAAEIGAAGPRYTCAADAHCVGRSGIVMSNHPFALAGSTESVSQPPRGGDYRVERGFRIVAIAAAFLLIALVGYIVWQIGRQALPAVRDYHIEFLTRTDWNVQEKYLEYCRRYGEPSTARWWRCWLAVSVD
jgi:hypothetical protein